MIEERFSASDLEPGPEEKAAAVRGRIERGAAVIAAFAAGAWVGGLVALGACAAPAVFSLAPRPYSGNAMGEAFARFDRVAIGASAVVLAMEVLRTWAARRRGATIVARVRRGLGVLMALSATYVGLAISPKINALHLAGAVRGEGDDGRLLDSIHRMAETIGKLEVVIGMALVALHILTLPSGASAEEDDELVAPLPPGPRP